jgi:hypothetical protein
MHAEDVSPKLAQRAKADCSEIVDDEHARRDRSLL